jgi:cell division protease FtsH
MAMPTSDRYGMTDTNLRARIRMAMGGRAAQVVFLQTVDTGASNDFKQAWNIAHRMVTEFGMSKLGPISIGEGGGNPFLGRQMASGHQVGGSLSDEIDRECQRIVTECYNEVVTMLERDKECFLKIVDVLMVKETILGPEFVKLRNETVCAVPVKPAQLAAPAAGEGSAVAAPAAEVAVTTVAPVAAEAPATAAPAAVVQADAAKEAPASDAASPTSDSQPK